MNFLTGFLVGVSAFAFLAIIGAVVVSWAQSSTPRPEVPSVGGKVAKNRHEARNGQILT